MATRKYALLLALGLCGCLIGYYLGVLFPPTQPTPSKLKPSLVAQAEAMNLLSEFNPALFQIVYLPGQSNGNSIDYATEYRSAPALTLVQLLDSIMKPYFYVQRLSLQPVDSHSYDLVIYVHDYFHDDFGNRFLSPVSQYQIFNALALTLKENTEIHGFQILDQNQKALPSHLGVLHMPEILTLGEYEPLTLMEESELTPLILGSSVVLQLAYSPVDAVVSPLTFDWQMREVTASYSTLEELTLRELCRPDAEISYPLCHAFVFSSIQVRGGIAYLNFICDETLLNAFGSHGTHVFYSYFLFLMSQFPRVEKVQFLFNGRPNALHGLMSFYIPNPVR